MSIPISQFIPPLRGIHTFILYVCVSISALWIRLSISIFFRFYINTLIYDICSSLSDLLQSVWPPLGPSMKVKVTQLCPALCNPIDYTVHGILQARILEWVAIPFSRASSQPRDRTQVSSITGGFFTSWATREAFFRGSSQHKDQTWASCIGRQILTTEPP